MHALDNSIQRNHESLDGVAILYFKKFYMEGIISYEIWRVGNASIHLGLTIFYAQTLFFCAQPLAQCKAGSKEGLQGHAPVG